MSKPPPPGKLYNRALELARSVPIETLYSKTLLPIGWLRKFRAGSIPTPGVQRVERVIVALTGKELL